MAHSISSLFTVVAILIGYSIGLGSALRLDVSPESINTMVTDQLDLTCLSNGPAGTRSIVTLGIMKTGDHPIAVISSKGLAKGPKWKDNVEAQGNLTNDAINSFLKLTIKNPDEEDTGTYVCLMYYLDANFEFHEMKTEVNITVENDDIFVIVKYLLKEIRTLQKREKSTQEEVTKLKDTISSQKVQLAEQDTNLMEQEKKLNEQRKENEKVSSRIVLLEGLEKHHSQSIKDPKAKDLSPVAFSYGYIQNDNTKVMNGKTLLFTKRIMDLGGHFNPSTGSFKAPIKGMYVFQLVVMTLNYDDSIRVDLYLESQTIATLYSYDKNSNDQSSVSTVTLIDKGEHVRPVVRYTDKDAIHPTDHYSYFTGYLLKPI